MLGVGGGGGSDHPLNDFPDVDCNHVPLEEESTGSPHASQISCFPRVKRRRGRNGKIARACSSGAGGELGVGGGARVKSNLKTAQSVCASENEREH